MVLSCKKRYQIQLTTFNIFSLCFHSVLLHYVPSPLSSFLQIDFPFLLLSQYWYSDLITFLSAQHPIADLQKRVAGATQKEDVVENVPAVRSNDIFSITDVGAVAWGTRVLRTRFVTRVHFAAFLTQSSCMETWTHLMILQSANA